MVLVSDLPVIIILRFKHSSCAMVQLYIILYALGKYVLI